MFLSTRKAKESVSLSHTTQLSWNRYTPKANGDSLERTLPPSCSRENSTTSTNPLSTTVGEM